MPLRRNVARRNGGLLLIRFPRHASAARRASFRPRRLPSSPAYAALAQAAEFEAFLECGILAHGFLRVRCEATGPECPWLLGCRPFAPRAATGIEAVACAHPSRGCSQSRIAGRMSVVSADGVAQDTV